MAAWPLKPSLTKFAPETFRRHTFVRLTTEAWSSALVETGNLDTLRDWLSAGRPLIVRRPCLSEDEKLVALGLALPGKKRLAYRLPVETVVSVEPPPAWRGDLLPIPGFTPRLFGSHAWQQLTGLTYVTDTSDLDLLVDIISPAEWQRFLALNLPLPPAPRIDLEVILSGDASFSWCEYLTPAKDILIKSNQRVWLEPRDNLSALLA